MKKTFTILLILVALASCSSVPEIVSGKGAVYGTISADSHKDIIAKASKDKDGIYGKNGKVIFTDKMVNYHNLKELFVCLLDPSFLGGNDHSLIATNENMSHRSMAIATGHMIVGNIGSEKNLEYTCIGDTVNYSSRLEGINKMYGTDIIINVFTKKNVEHDLLLWKLDTIQVKGRAQGSQIFEVMAEKKNAPQEQIRIKSDYEAALVLYRKGDFIQAGEAFVSLFNANNDIPSKNMSERCREYIDTPPKNWLGVTVMKEK